MSIHSWGLEAAWQQGEVDGLDRLRVFLEASIQQAGYASLPLLNDAYRSPEQLEAFYALADAFLLNTVANRASRIQGRTLLGTAGRIWPSAQLAALQTRADATCAHVAPLAGATFGLSACPWRPRRRSCCTGRRAACCRRPCGSALPAASKHNGCKTHAVRGWIGSPIAAAR